MSRAELPAPDPLSVAAVRLVELGNTANTLSQLDNESPEIAATLAAISRDRRALWRFILEEVARRETQGVE